MHLREFNEVCNTYNDSNCSMNTIRLKLFPFSLKDKAKTWLQNLRSGSIRAWDKMQQQFLKLFPSHRTNFSNNKSPLSLKNQEKHFTSVGIGIETCLIHVLIMVLKHENWFHTTMKGSHLKIGKWWN